MRLPAQRRTLTEVHLLWKQGQPSGRLRSAVSLHSHTSHSREVLDFLPIYMRKVPLLRSYAARSERKSEHQSGRAVDYSRTYWTPPLAPQQVLASERDQIERRLGLRPLVSLTDHDHLDACTLLQIVEHASEVPMSVEWTVPFHDAQFHVGIHDLPSAAAHDLVAELRTYTARPELETLKHLLNSLNEMPGVLIVLNHPLSDQTFLLGRARHEDRLREFLRLSRGCLHALELNGLHSPQENRDVLALAREIALPAISGGDRHGYEPNANVNLSEASTFAEFVHEVRYERVSRIAFMPHYREPLSLRIFENIGLILRRHPELAGRERWSDRVFYDNGSGPIALSMLMPDGGPPLLRCGLAVLDWLTHPHIFPKLRFVFGPRLEVTL